MRKHIYLAMVASVIGLIISLGGCGKKGTKTPEPDEILAAEKVKLANSALEDKLYTWIFTELEGVERPENIDFSVSSNLYKEALQLNPDNLDANFGAGLTEILMVTMDSEVNTVFDKWDEYMDTASIFVPKSAIYSEKNFAKKISHQNFPPGEKSLMIPSHFLLRSVSSVFYTGLTNPPQIHEIQNLIENKLFPRVDYALEHLKKITSNPQYTFTITPKMQGDLEEDPLEMDMTEIYLIITGLDLLKTLCNIAISYNFDFPSYDSAGMAQVIPQNSDFLSLRSSGASKLASAKSAFLDACDNLEDAVYFLRNETDNQSDDIVKIDPDGVTDEDLDSISAYIPRVRNTLLSSENVTADFDDDGMDETVAFAVGAFFDHPIDNLKKDLLPGYTTRVERDSSGWVPVIIWNANSFDQWIFPDPTFKGILPGITTDSELKQTFGIDPSDWNEELRLEIYEDFD